MITALLMLYAAGAGFTLAILLDYVIADWKDLLALVLATLIWPLVLIYSLVTGRVM